jgi:hypothetical protein
MEKTHHPYQGAQSGNGNVKDMESPDAPPSAITTQLWISSA